MSGRRLVVIVSVAARAVNVTIHGLGRPARPLEDGEDQVWVSIGRFEELLDVAIGRPDVTITFDDGNLSDLEIGLPRLLERGLTGRFYIPAGLLGEPGRLDDDGVRELHRAGMAIGSHGWAHRDWRRLPWGNGVEVEEEMVRARRHLERLVGSEVTEVAVPFGSYDRHVLRALRRTGVSRVYTSDGGWARTGSWLQPRTSIHAADPPGWPHRVMVDRPGLREQARGPVVGLVKRVRGRPHRALPKPGYVDAAIPPGTGSTGTMQP
jgi:peptidoglycan/xylan/chitin deacetylase (PgdA/CDA1 family)